MAFNMKRILTVLMGLAISTIIFAQEQLPDFSVYKVGGGRIVIAWTHNYKDITQLSIQRSYNKINFFKTIANMPDPSIQQNGFADMTAPTDSMYYRIYVQFAGGRFFSTVSKMPTVDSVGLADAYNSNRIDPLPTNFLPEGFTPSKYIFTSPDRYVRIELPFDNKNYDIKFFTDAYQPLFELTNFKERRFKIDKSYFISAGYVNFEIYANGQLVEKYKLYIPREF